MSVASKNIFELLGNDPDSDGEVKAPTRQVIKQVQTTKKKDVVVEAPAATQKPRNNRKYQGNEAAIRDREAGHEKNKGRTDGVEAGEGGYRHRGDREGGRGGRGASRGDKRGGGRGRPFDRHSQTGRVDTAKATGQGWGANTGDAEWSDEKTGEAIAQGEATGTGYDAADPATAEAEPVKDGEVKEEEPEEKLKTYEEYQQELKEKRAALNAPAQIRKPNEGSRDNKKWENATVLDKVDEDVYVAPKEGKAKAPKERKTKQLLEIEHSYQEPRSERGGRGGRGRGEGRGGRGRGEGRGGNRGGDRPARGGARGGAGASVNLADESAFPALA
ncbi:hypothetical protein BJ508DRAFT_100370 [Ascobolus immersus RN42]|uniref:Hyaluronan/mRNA-binding protein domain-containing protein n=1 Tax=Ascobolus immersus RN42 TaxID=1160509 RepID=A0A3N4I7J4_ASCIM|nr:hypothetical protein BJ508DRAFT_100370 [Ascobolus immersus RN42]